MGLFKSAALMAGCPAICSARFSERWREDDPRNMSLPRFAYFPFGGGPRVCIGAGFGMMEAILLLGTIAQKFKLNLVPDQTIEKLPSVTLRPKNGIRVRITRR